MKIKRFVADGFDGGDDDGKIFGPAARHDGVDRDLLDGCAPVVGRDERHQLAGLASGRRDGPLHEAAGRRDDREAVGDAARVETLDRVGVQVGVDRRHGQRLTQSRQGIGDGERRRSGAGPRQRVAPELASAEGVGPATTPIGPAYP